jgi:hypothetical protein
MAVRAFVGSVRCCANCALELAISAQERAKRRFHLPTLARIARSEALRWQHDASK